MIKKYYLNKKKDGSKYDRQKKQYFSWGYDIWLSGERRQERGFFDQKDAENAVKQLKGEHKNNSLGITSAKKIPQLIELFQKKLNDMAGPDRARAKRVFNNFLALLPRNIKVTELKKPHFQAYKDKRVQDGVSLATIRRELVPVVAALNSAGDYFEALENFAPPKRPRLKISKLRKNKTITFEERKAILEKLLAPRERYDHDCRRRTGLLLQFCLLTVSRPGEIAALKKADIDWHAGIVRITGSKTRFVSENPIRELFITPTMAAILRERYEAATGDYLFTNGGKITGAMYAYLKAACESHGIKYGKADPDGVTFHRARHTATTVLAHSNQVDVKTIGDFTGHSDENMTLYYSHTNPETLKKAGEILEENMGSKLYVREFLETKSENN